MARSLQVTIAIAAMNQGTEAMADALDPTLFRSDIKGPACPNENPSNVDALFAATGEGSSDDIPRLEALDHSGTFGLGTRETDLVDIAFLAAAESLGGDQQRAYLPDVEGCRGARSHADGIQPVRFGKPSCGAVPLGTPASPRFKGQSEQLQPFV